MREEKFDKVGEVMGVGEMDGRDLGYMKDIGLVWGKEGGGDKLLEIIGELGLVGKGIKGGIIGRGGGDRIKNKFGGEVGKEMGMDEIEGGI